MAIVTEYGFTLGEISSITSSDTIIYASIKKGSAEAISYILQYDQSTDKWFGEGIRLEEVPKNAGHYRLAIGSFEDTDIGDEYIVNLSLPESPTQSFVNACHMVSDTYRIDVKQSVEHPDGYLDIQAGELYELAKTKIVFISNETKEGDNSYMVYGILQTAGKEIFGNDTLYGFEFLCGMEHVTFIANGADDYPAISDNS